MDGFKVNFRDFNQDAHPAGMYDAVVIGAELRANRDNTADYLNVTYELMGDDPNGKPLTFNKRIWDIVSLKEEAAFRVLAYLKAFEIPYKEQGFQLECIVDDEDNRTYSGLKFGEPGENGNPTFVGFITDDDTVWPIIGSMVKLELAVEKRVTANGDDGDDRNTVKSVKLVTRPSGEVPSDANSGSRFH